MGWRRDKTANAERRKQSLPEGPYIDYPLRMIEPAQRRHRLAAESILAIVVVLDDPGVMPFGDRQKPQPLVHAHYSSEWPLAGRCHVDHSGGRQTRIAKLPSSLMHAQRRELGATT